MAIQIKNGPKGCKIMGILLCVYTLVGWIVNLYKLIACDGEPPYKDEIIHAVGLIPIVSWFTAWM